MVVNRRAGSAFFYFFNQRVFAVAVDYYAPCKRIPGGSQAGFDFRYHAAVGYT
jgi:hypothetical protein